MLQASFSRRRWLQFERVAEMEVYGDRITMSLQRVPTPRVVLSLETLWNARLVATAAGRVTGDDGSVDQLWRRWEYRLPFFFSDHVMNIVDYAFLRGDTLLPIDSHKGPKHMTCGL